MNKFLTLSDIQRQTVFEQMAVKRFLPPQAIEKDFWVTETLRLLFSLPYADKMVFKGGTSLSKAWGVIHRFSEDIDIAIDRHIFGFEGDVTKKQLSKLRKASSVFVRDTLASDLTTAANQDGLHLFLSVRPAPNGTGDATYPEPRQIYVTYKSVLPKPTQAYLRSEILLEVGARSLFDPIVMAKVNSMVDESFPHLTSGEGIEIIVAAAEKTFLEKVFLLHELFSTDGCQDANRKSRHLYDLYKMMEHNLADLAIRDLTLWESIQHHRSVFTSIRGIDYTSDIRKQLHLIPPQEVMHLWQKDYEEMVCHMIYETPVPTFDKILNRIKTLEERFRK